MSRCLSGFVNPERLSKHCLPYMPFKTIITFSVSGRRREYVLVTRVCLCVCLSVPRRIPTLLHGPGCDLGSGRRCPLVVYCWADLQAVHGFRCYDDIAQTCLCVILSLVPRCIPTLLHGPGCNLGNGRGCPLVAHYWADLQSVHGFRCFDNIART